jgi:hypothetical protein
MSAATRSGVFSELIKIPRLLVLGGHDIVNDCAQAVT